MNVLHDAEEFKDLELATSEVSGQTLRVILQAAFLTSRMIFGTRHFVITSLEQHVEKAKPLLGDSATTRFTSQRQRNHLSADSISKQIARSLPNITLTPSCSAIEAPSMNP